MTTKGIYIHIPFCYSKCTYCDFYSVAKDTELMERYVNSVVEEIKEIGKTYPTSADTVYIGGGTPSVLPPFLIEKIVKAVYSNFGNAVKEFTMEANPCSCNYIKEYRAMGINRISLGVQSLNNDVLRTIGRRHNATEALKKLDELSGTFDNISADLMLGLPGQTVDDVIYATKEVCSRVKHLSAYMLKLSDTVPMYKSAERGDIVLPDDDLTVDMYESVYDVAESFGLSRYEISNFAVPGYESKHNLKYWNREEYIGVGCAAHGFIGSFRYNNPYSIEKYIGGERFGKGRAEVNYIDYNTALFERIMLAFRLPSGIDVKAINAEFQIDFESVYADALKRLEPVLKRADGRIFIAKDKMLLESAVAREFLP